MSSDDPTTEELRREQLEQESASRELAREGLTEEETLQHERRAEKAGYLREKLEERAEAEREAAGEN
jgi:hypothetical protein